jgi:hypothetical protein
VRRREGFPSKVKRRPKSAIGAMYLPAAVTLHGHTTGANIASTFGGRALTIVSRPFQGYRKITISLWVLKTAPNA